MMQRFVPLLSFAAVLAACQTTIAEQPPQRLGSATLRLADGTAAGTARLYGEGASLNVSVALSGMAPGEHAVHLHAVGSCEGPDFTSAGPHLNPAGQQHGTENPSGAHLGNLPNARIGESGTGMVSATLRLPRAQALETLFDADGTAIVVHESADDYRTDPSGAAGSRIACGVLTPG